MTFRMVRNGVSLRRLGRLLGVVPWKSRLSILNKQGECDRKIIERIGMMASWLSASWLSSTSKRNSSSSIAGNVILLKNCLWKRNVIFEALRVVK